MEITSQELSENILEALNILGTGKCKQPGCEGCIWEREEARQILTIAYAKYENKLCKVCKGNRYQKDPHDPNTLNLCEACEGSGVQKGYDPLTNYFNN